MLEAHAQARVVHASTACQEKFAGIDGWMDEVHEKDKRAFHVARLAPEVSIAYATATSSPARFA